MTANRSQAARAAIARKQGGVAVNSADVRAIIESLLAGSINETEMAGFLKAVATHGMNDDETLALTIAMRDSGRILSWPRDGRPVVDRHSTGGVGDPSTMIVVPMLASLGARCPSLSTRSAGILGGTIEKLDSVPGIELGSSSSRMQSLVQQNSCAIAESGRDLAPADRVIFAIRSRTGTMTSIPLMVSSILSKKAAAGIQTLALDVKYGPGMLLGNLEQADRFERSMRFVAGRLGIGLVVLFSEARAPASRAVGTWLEVKEANAYLAGHRCDALAERVSTTVANLAVACGLARDLPSANKILMSAIDSGNALLNWRSMLCGQGADLTAFDEKLARDVVGSALAIVCAPVTGYVSHCDPVRIGQAARLLSGGTDSGGKTLNHDVGVDQILLPGAAYNSGDALARIQAPTQRAAAAARDEVAGAFRIDRTRDPSALAVIACRGDDHVGT